MHPSKIPESFECASAGGLSFGFAGGQDFRIDLGHEFAPLEHADGSPPILCSRLPGQFGDLALQFGQTLCDDL